MTQLAVVDAEGDVSCGCGDECAHAPVLEEVVLPPSRPRTVGMLAIDRAGLVALARARGIVDVAERRH